MSESVDDPSWSQDTPERSTSSPVAAGLSMPPEWAPHERMLMAWPVRAEMWADLLEQAKADYAETARAIARFEPVLMVAPPGGTQEVRDACGSDGIDIVELPIDDSWLRDSGPIILTGPDGRRAGVHFRFNSWGEKFLPYDKDAAVGGLLLDHLGIERYDAPLVLEGGSIHVDGTGTLITTEQCLLSPSRNPTLTRVEIEAELRRWLGVERIVWLRDGLVEDRDTDGHVDLVCAPTRPSEVLLQTVADPADPNFAGIAENRAILDAAGIAVRELPILHRHEQDGETTALTCMNYVLCNGGVVVPVPGREDDDEQLATIAAAYPGREVVGVPGVTLALGGGGVHCITQQVPAVPSATA